MRLLRKPNAEKIGNLIITIITAFISTFFMQSCMNLNEQANILTPYKYEKNQLDSNSLQCNALQHELHRRGPRCVPQSTWL